MDEKLKKKSTYVLQFLQSLISPSFKVEIEKYDVQDGFDRFFTNIPATSALLKLYNKHNPEPNVILFGEQVIPIRNAKMGITNDINVIKVMIDIKQAESNPFSFTSRQLMLLRVGLVIYVIMGYLFYCFVLSLLQQL